MFTSTMTYEEIYQIIYKEVLDVYDHYQKVVEPKAKRELKKAIKFPKRITFNWKHPKTLNTYTYYIQSNRRSQWDNPFLTVFSEYEGKNGKELLCIAPHPNKTEFLLNVYSSHFFKRYRERVLKEDTDYYQTIAIYLMRNSRTEFLGKDYVSNKEQLIELPGFSQEAMLTVDGLGLGWKNDTGTIVIYKTFLGIDQLHDDQLKKVWIEHLSFFLSLAKESSPRYKHSINNLLIELTENIRILTDDSLLSKEEKNDCIFHEYEKTYQKLNSYLLIN